MAVLQYACRGREVVFCLAEMLVLQIAENPVLQILQWSCSESSCGFNAHIHQAVGSLPYYAEIITALSIFMPSHLSNK